MNHRIVLILNLSPGTTSATRLKDILNTYLYHPIDICEVTAEDSSAFLFNKNAVINISHPPPSLILLIVSSSFHNKINLHFTFLRKHMPCVPIIIVSEENDSHTIIKCLDEGAIDFITLPIEKTNVIPRLWRLINQTKEDTTLLYNLKEKKGLKKLVGQSPAFVEVIRKIPRISRCDAVVLLKGETGTGKELCARAIHYLSSRSDKPFIPINCGAIPAELLENELFGHVKGAYTSADVSHSGLIREAEGGTLFLDEVDSLSYKVQIKFLRFLQEKEYRQIGSTKLHKADIRIIAATNNNLEKLIQEEKFRKDFYYRLNIISLELPPLRKRCEDIILLARFFLKKFASELNKNTIDFTPQACEKLMLYEWPGNVRELENVIHRAVIMSEQPIIDHSDVSLHSEQHHTFSESFKEVKARVVAQFEKSYITGLLHVHNGNISRAAKAAQKNRRAFWQLIHKHQIDVQSFKE